MNLLKQAQVAICNLKIEHAKRDLRDYEEVLDCYMPNVPLFDKIIEKVEEINSIIKNLEEIRDEPFAQEKQ